VPRGGRLDNRVRRRPREQLYQVGNPSLPMAHNQNTHTIATVAVKKYHGMTLGAYASGIAVPSTA